MSDIFVSAGLKVDLPRLEQRLRWMPYTATWSGAHEGLSWAMSRVDDPILWAPAFDPQRRVRVLLGGRIALEDADWNRAERLTFDGGLAARHVLDTWLTLGPSGLERLNGAALAVIIDENRRDVYVQTDRMGFYPAFAWSGRGFVLSSHQDGAADVLEQAGYPCDFDPVTMAEFLRTGTATHPHTYWHGISQLDAGTHYRAGYRGTADLTKVKSYWRPAYFDGRYLSNRREIVERLTQALGNAVRRRTQPRLGKVAVLLSSGADSRAALFGAQNPSDVVAFTMFDEPNAELDGARRLAAAAGAKHVEFKRTQDYYIKHAAEAVRISGGMWTIESAHYGGLLPELNAAKPGVVLTGCYADYLLKGITYDTRPKTLFGRALPLNDLISFDYEWHHPYVELSSLWQERVKQRLALYFADFASGENISPSLLEYRRLAPIIREPDASGRLFLKRTSPTDLFMSDNDVLELFGSISPEQKINAIPFGMAVDRICGVSARNVLNNNYGAPVGASEFRRVASFVRSSLRRKILGKGSGQPYDANPRSIATVGSWPHIPRVIEFSTELHRWLADIPKEQGEILFDIVGMERRAWTVEDWAQRAPTLFLRLFTASLWLSQNPAAITRRRLND